MAGLTLGASITVAGSSTVGEVAVGALSSGAGNAANQLISQGEIKGGELLNSTIIGGVSGPLSVKGGMLVEKSGANAIKAIESEATSTIANAKNIAYSQVEQTGAKMGGKHAKQQVNKEANSYYVCRRKYQAADRRLSLGKEIFRTVRCREPLRYASRTSTSHGA